MEFSDRFKTDLHCKEYLAYLKWKNGFERTGCGQVFWRVLLPIEPFAKEGDTSQQPDNEYGQRGQIISEGNYMQLTTDLYRNLISIFPEPSPPPARTVRAG